MPDVMNELLKNRIAYALKCKPSEVPTDPEELKKQLDMRRAKLKKDKEAKHG